MQGIGKVARSTVVAARALHVSRAGMGPVPVKPVPSAPARLPRTAGSRQAGVVCGVGGGGGGGMGALGPRQLHQARHARRGRGVTAERTLVTSSFSPDDEGDTSNDTSSDTSSDTSNDTSKYSSSVDDVVGFGRVIRDPRKSKADVLRDSLASNAKSAPGDPSLNPRTLEKTGKPIILSNAETKTQDEWAQLDEHINEYPGERSFKAIGAGEADFVRSMRECVEKVVGGIEDSQVDTKESSGGKYVSVTFLVMVQSPEEMKEIYELMKGDGRLKFFI